MKRVQAPLCVSVGEPINGKRNVYIVNDTEDFLSVNVKIVDAETGENVFCGVYDCPEHRAVQAGKAAGKEDFAFWLIEWSAAGVSGKNHYVTNTDRIDLDRYISCMKKAGMFEFLP